MIIKEVDDLDRQKWNDFVLENKGEFLQSWEWGEFQKSTGKKIWRLATGDDNGKILCVALIIRHSLPFGKNYLYCPKGPVFKNPKPNPPAGGQNPKFLNLFLDKLKEIARKENSVFLRLESEGETEFPIGNSVSQYPAPNLQPHDTLILDITKPEEQLLAEMKQKTRYNIKLAERHGVKVRASDERNLAEDFEKFWSLIEETARRDKIKTHPQEYYKKMFTFQYPPAGGEGGLDKFEAKDKNYQNQPIVKLFLAEWKGKILAANIVIFFGNRATYLHGASSSAFRNLMAPHLLQWEQIKKSRRLGFKEYDFWGIDSSGNKKSWEGITRFKRGFSGKEINYPEAIDFICQPLIYKAIRAAKKIKDLF